MTRKKILAEFLGVSTEDIEQGHTDKSFMYGDEEYLVLTEEEAYETAREYVRQYVDDVVYSQIPENLQPYFNEEQFIEDVMRIDGVEILYSLYSGLEDEFTDDEGNTWYIYTV